MGLAIPNDVYLTYSIFILTSAMRITVFPLHLRSESPYTADISEATSLSASLSLSTSLSGSKGKGKAIAGKENTGDSADTYAGADDGPPPYISLLTPQPFTVPPALDKRIGLPSTPRLSLPPAPAFASSTTPGDFALTADTLRYLATTVKTVSDEIARVTIAQRDAATRSVVQQQEFTRMRSTCAMLVDRIAKLEAGTGAARDEPLQAKLERLVEAQGALMKRLDGVLGSLARRASPELSESETRWFEELGRMKEEVVGAGRYDERSLVARTKLVRLACLLSSFLR